MLNSNFDTELRPYLANLKAKRDVLQQQLQKDEADRIRVEREISLLKERENILTDRIATKSEICAEYDKAVAMSEAVYTKARMSEVSNIERSQETSMDELPTIRRVVGAQQMKEIHALAKESLTHIAQLISTAFQNNSLPFDAIPLSVWLYIHKENPAGFANILKSVQGRVFLIHENKSHYRMYEALAEL